MIEVDESNEEDAIFAQIQIKERFDESFHLFWRRASRVAMDRQQVSDHFHLLRHPEYPSARRAILDLRTVGLGNNNRNNNNNKNNINNILPTIHAKP